MGISKESSDFRVFFFKMYNSYSCFNSTSFFDTFRVFYVDCFHPCNMKRVEFTDVVFKVVVLTVDNVITRIPLLKPYVNLHLHELDIL